MSAEPVDSVEPHVTATAVADALILTRRNLLHYVRIPSLIVFSTITPVMFVILFGYVFGGAIDIPGFSYIDFLMPGIFVQTVAFGAMQTGIGLAEDMSKGMVDRLRSLPMARSAVLVGRTAADTIRNFLVVGLMAGVGLLIGFRFHNGLVPAVAGLGAGGPVRARRSRGSRRRSGCRWGAWSRPSRRGWCGCSR